MTPPKKQFSYRNGIAKRIDTSEIELTEKDRERIQLTINNPKGHNKHTPKSELVPKKIHPYKLMSQDDRFKELTRLYNERKYHSHFVMQYGHKIDFLMTVMGIKKKKADGELRAEKEFKEKEGEWEE